MKKNENIFELQYIKGIGAKRAEVFAKENINSAIDVINFLPRTYIDRNSTDSIKMIIIQQLSAKNNSEVNIDNFLVKQEYTLVAKIANKLLKQYSNKKKYLKLTIQDNFGTNATVMFWNYADYYNKSYEIGDLVSITGRAELSDKNNLSFSQPDINKIDTDETITDENAIIPIYRSTESFKRTGITNKLLTEVIRNVLDKKLPELQETLPKNLLNKYKLPDIKSAYQAVHIPKNYEEIEAAKKRFKFEEIFFFELYLALKQSGLKNNEKGILIPPKSKLARSVYQSLKFKLTKDQIKVINEIALDMSSGRQMNRLLQGDVGSGKTIIAALCMLSVIDKGYQVALMAPTGILAEQHYNSFKKLLDGFDINITLITGGSKNKRKLNDIEKVNQGESQIIIGTHTLFEDYMKFNNLGLVVIDEQHRFGVEQKAKTILAAKASNAEHLAPHTLVMSATPIPRTLALTVYGDLDVSVIKEMPANRLPIRTKVAFDSNVDFAYQFIKEQIDEGSQAYIVFPLVEKSDILVELKSAIEHYDVLKDTVFYDYKCGLLHGQMAAGEKEQIMEEFYNKKYDILIATTVIEVGIDVPNATVMLIQDAHKFGLSQLHQLRGRVGRSDKQSYCILVTKDNYKYEFKRNYKDESELKAIILRLKTMERTNDGFDIAEVDLKLRGPGDILGTKQSGLPEFKFIDLVSDGDIITLAKNEAFKIIRDDNNLSKKENSVLKNEIIKRYRGQDHYLSIA